jgi:hypothetical protein
MTSRGFAGAAILTFLSTLCGTAAAQEAKPTPETKPQEGAPAPKAADPAAPAAQPMPAEATPPPVQAEPPAPAPAAPPPVVPPPPTPTDLALVPVPEQPAPDVNKQRMIFSAGVGYTAGGSVKHPELTGTSYSGEMLELGGGVELSPKWRLMVAFTSFQTKLERVGTSGKFQRAALHGGAGYQPLVGCSECSTSGGQGGLLVKQPLHVHTLGPRLDFLPFGNDSLFVGVTAGAAMMQDLSFRGGVALAARAGYEWRPYPVFGISLEAGAHGQVYSDSSAALPYAALSLRLLAVPPSVSRNMPGERSEPTVTPVATTSAISYK